MRTIIECQRRAKIWKEEEKFWERASEYFWLVMAILAWGMSVVEIYKAV